MFVRVYRFKVKSKDFETYREIERKASMIYKKHGITKHITLFRKGKSFTNILLLEFYKSEKEFKRILKKVNADKRILKKVNADKRIKELWKRFLRISVGRVHGEGFLLGR